MNTSNHNSSWQKVKLGDLASFRYGAMKKGNLSSGKFPIFSGYKIVGYTNDEYNANENLLVVARGVGGTGDVKISPKLSWVTNLSIILDLNEEVVDKKFLYYIFKKTGLRYLDSGSAQSQITIQDLQRLELNLPRLDVQKKIVTILSAFDDKIELNNKINATLEKMAQAIFKEWFVEFRFPGYEKAEFVDSEVGKIPKGWRVKKITEIFDLIKGIEPGSNNYSEKRKSDDYLPFYRVQNIANYGETPDIFVEKELLGEKVFKAENILISLDGAIGRVFIGGAGGYSSGIRKVVGRENYISKSLIFCFLKSKNFQNSLASFSGDETTIKHAGKAIDHIFFPIEIDICKKFEKTVNPIYDKIISNISQIRTLSTLRDLLLPKLMKGEVSV